VILVDTSVWVDHLRASDDGLRRLLHRGEVLSHPFIIGELALGNLRQRDVVLDALIALPRAGIATDPEMIFFIGEHRLFGQGIGYVDAHLLASASLTAHAQLWTRDRRLNAVAEGLGLAAAVS